VQPAGYFRVQRRRFPKVANDGQQFSNDVWRADIGPASEVVEADPSHFSFPSGRGGANALVVVIASPVATEGLVVEIDGFEGLCLRSGMDPPQSTH
jgi:hypothetical protein